MSVNLNKVNPVDLAALIEVDGESWEGQSSSQLSRIWHEQPRLPFGNAGDDITGSRPGTIGEFISHPSPPVEGLIQLKDYANQHRHHLASPLPLPVVMMLYYASILLARSCHKAIISQLSDRELLKGIRWAVEQDWIDASLRDRFIQAQSALNVSTKDS
jgi:hypothetical protein